MKVSVIIPFYSQIEWLEEALDSVLNQTFTDYEILVINDGSPEDESAFLEKYNTKINYFKTENRGPAHARNFGIDKAKGVYLAFLDSDDLWFPDKLEKQVKLMDKTGLVWSHTKYAVFDNVPDRTQREFQNINNENYHGNIYPLCLTKLHIGTPCVMVRRDYLLKNPLIRFSENMRFGQDGYLWILLGIDNELGYCPECLTLVRRLGSNAVQRARVHLNVRANLYSNLVKNIKNIFPKVSISKGVQITYLYCYYMNSFVNKLFHKQHFKNSSAEMIAKILYFPAYLTFKFIK